MELFIIIHINISNDLSDLSHRRQLRFITFLMMVTALILITLVLKHFPLVLKKVSSFYRGRVVGSKP